MLKKLNKIILLLPICILFACSDSANTSDSNDTSDSTNTSGAEPNIKVQIKSPLHYAEYLSEIFIIGMADSATISAVEANRGNCEMVSLQRLDQSFPVLEMDKTLLFGQKLSLMAKCSVNDLQELKVQTDTGTFTFTF